GVEIDIPADLNNLRVPALILQPLVENAVKHGVSQNKLGGLIKISAKLETLKGEVFLKLSVYDSGAGKPDFETTADFEKMNSDGIGLKNIRERLESYYGAKAFLN